MAFLKFILDRTILLMLRRFHGLAEAEELGSERLHLKVCMQQSLLLKSEKRDEKMLSGEPESLHCRCVEISVVFRQNRAVKKKSACSGEIFTGTQGRRECAAENSLRVETIRANYHLGVIIAITSVKACNRDAGVK